MRIGADPLGGASVDYWARIADRFDLDLTVVNHGASSESILIKDQLPAGLTIVDGDAAVLTALPAGVETALARFPGQREAVERRRDAVGQQQPIDREQRHRERNVDARPGMHLPLELIAVDIDETRQDEQSTAVETLA